ncbi:hypothetical protein AK812_SmicGene45021 [Symbiodinium microadriaticum]|uniref:Uncharacterized protein n=1 Tax=Symbiodinium microadriaticum TaxID=2951 RepID=A0A1Q9BWZ3_SYMMI|nr:hypothetical protein AK812_SmicGene45021 [Symbiodinium microadriaticum]
MSAGARRNRGAVQRRLTSNMPHPEPSGCGARPRSLPDDGIETGTLGVFPCEDRQVTLEVALKPAKSPKA